MIQKQLQKDKKLSNIKLINHKFRINKKIKIKPLSQTLINSPRNLFSLKDSKSSLSLNTTDKEIKNKSKFYKSSINFGKDLKDIEPIKKDEDASQLPFSNKKLPISLRKEYKYINYIPNYPKTFYQKISNSIQKMKIQADKTLDIMKKNLKISDREIFRRSTSVINIHTIKKQKAKPKQDKLKDKYYKYEDYLDYEKYDMNDYIQASNTNRLNKTIYNLHNLHNDYTYNYQLLGLSKIPSISFNDIKNKPFYIPLFNNLEKKRKFYKNMYHHRSFEMKEKILTKNSNKIYDPTNKLVGITSYVKEPEIQLKFIFNKIKLILDNIKHFKINYMFKKDFRQAFINMENQIKAEFNYIIEELCTLLIRIIPQLLKGFYNSLDQLLFIKIPEIDEEMQKKPSNEIECLKYNINFYIKVSDYFSACVDIYNVIQKQIAEFKYTSAEFEYLNMNLDLARYDSTRLISMSDSYIEKTKKDEKVFSKFEIGLNLKAKKIEVKEKIDGFERFHRRRRIKIVGDRIKIDRINSALNIGNKGLINNFMFNKKKRIIKDNKNTSILNSSLIKNMMKYFQKNVKAKIISQQVIERFKTNELNRLKNLEENNNSINEIC